MDALFVADGASSTRPSESAAFVRLSALGAVALAWLVAIVLLMRRVSGAAGESPDVVSLWLIAVLMVLLSGGARWLWRASNDGARNSYLHVAMDWGCLPAMALAGWAVAIPGATVASLAGFAAIVVVAEAWALRGYGTALRRSKQSRRVEPKISSAVGVLPQREGELGGSESPENDPDDRIRIDPPQTPAPHFPTADIAQQLIRRVDADGNESIEGWVRAVFEPGQRTSSAHVAFCPTLEGTLSISFSHADGPEARVKAAQVLPYGVRFDVKLADASEIHDSVLVEFVAKGSAVAITSAD
jgi:hypothetical protein